MTAHVICYNNLVSLTAVSTLPYSGAGEVPIWQGISLPAVFSSDGRVQRCQKAFYSPPHCFTAVSVEHLLVPLGKGSVQLLKQNVAVCFLERRGRVEKNLQALFIFQESRMVVKYCKYYSLPIICVSDWLPASAWSSQLESFICEQATFAPEKDLNSPSFFSPENIKV